MKTKETPGDIDGYIAAFPVHIQHILQKIRLTIKKAAPDALEKISYQMPAFTLKGILVYFAAHKNHIGFYPTSSGIKVFKDELAGYNFSKGAIQFPIDKPIPLKLITKIVKFRVEENLEKAEIKANRNKSDNNN